MRWPPPSGMRPSGQPAGRPAELLDVRIPAWRGFLAGGLVAAVAYFLLPHSEHIAAFASTVFAFGSAAAVALGVRRHRPATRGPWYLIAAPSSLSAPATRSCWPARCRDLADRLLPGHLCRPHRGPPAVGARPQPRPRHPGAARRPGRHHRARGGVVAVPDGPLRPRPVALARPEAGLARRSRWPTWWCWPCWCGCGAAAASGPPPTGCSACRSCRCWSPTRPLACCRWKPPTTPATSPREARSTPCS